MKISNVHDIETGELFTQVDSLVLLPKNSRKLGFLKRFYSKKFELFSYLADNFEEVYDEVYGTENVLIPQEEEFISPMVIELFKELEEEERARKKELLESFDDRKQFFNENQIDKYFEFKETMKGKLGENLASKFSDNVYCRYLTGYEWDLKTAEEKMVGMAKWSVAEKFFERNLFEDFKSLLKLQFVSNVGHDVDGRPIFYFCLRRFLPSMMDPDQIAIFNGVFVHHYLKEANQKTDNYHIIYDSRKVTGKNLDIGLFKKLTPVLGSYFPETLYRMYLIHANFIIRGAFSACKSFIHPRTAKKIHVVGSDAKQIETTFRAEGITPECLPTWLGGTMEGEGVTQEPPQNE